MNILMLIVALQTHLGFCKAENRPFNWTAWFAQEGLHGPVEEKNVMTLTQNP